MLPRIGELLWVTPYGIALVLSLFACWYYARSRAPEFGIDKSHIDLAVPLIFILSTLGGRALALVSPGDLEAGVFHDVHVRFRLFGLLLFAFPLLFAYCRISRVPFRKALDMFALPAVLWLIILRIGCFFAGCCWGTVTGSPTGVSFPHSSLAWEQQVVLGLIPSDAGRSLPIHPTQLYELVLLAGWLLILTRFERQIRAPGLLAAVTLGGYTLLRFGLEFVRADSDKLVAGLSFTQLLCVILLLLTGMAAKILCRPIPGFATRTRTST